jgi:predicted RNase H-like HicB family nuclease
MALQLNVVIEKDADGFYAYCPELPGCQTQGASFEEVMANLKEAAELYLETLPKREQRKIGRKQIVTTAMEVSIA